MCEEHCDTIVGPDHGHTKPMQGNRRDALARGLLAALIVLNGTFFFSLAQTWPDVSDTIGYAYAGQRLAAGYGLTFEDVNNQIAGPYFSLYAFQIRRAGDPRMFLGFPPGFPILLAAGIVLTGSPTAVYYVVPLLAILGLLATFYLGVLISDNEWTGLWAATLLTLAPAYWDFGTSPWSEVPSLTLVTVGTCLYLVSRAGGRSKTRSGVVLSVLSGIIIAYSFFIRYANVAIVPFLMACEWYTARKQYLTEWQRWPFAGLLGIGLVAIPVFNQIYYGGPLLTSYSPAHGWYPWPAFSLSYALGPSPVGGYSLIETGRTLWNNFPWLLLAVPVGWLLLVRPPALLIGGATLGTVALYSVYAFAPVGLNSRFLLPVFPFISVTIAHAVTHAGARLGSRGWRWGAGIVLAAILCLPVPGRISQLHARNTWNLEAVRQIRAMVAPTPADAVFLSYGYNDQIAFYGRRSVLNYRRIPPSDAVAGRYRVEVLEPCLVQTIDRLLDKHIPVYYVEDKSPPFWDSLAIIQRHFVTKLTQQDPKVHQVIGPIESGSRDGLSACEP